MIIQTERLLLRPFCESDKDWYCNLVLNEEFRKRLPGLAALNSMQAYQHVELFEKGDFINDFYYVITDKANNVLGIIVAVRITSKTVDVSYFLDKEYRQNGYMYEALQSFIKRVRIEVEPYCFRMVIDGDNIDSLKVIKRFEPVIEMKNTKYVCYV